jgi:hypothetical protein
MKQYQRTILKYRYPLIILACCLVSFWPLTFGVFSLKNDATLYFLPIRFQISEMIRNGHFPFWTPYLNLGYPLYSDMQAGVWNPFVYFISLFGSYTMRSLQFEMLIYVYISGVSMFSLLKYFEIDLKIACLVAISYMLCGFNLDSAQFAYWISGTAFLPAIFLFYHKMLHAGSIKDSLRFSLFLWLLFVCGYPAEFVIIFYFLIGYFIIYLVKERLVDLRRLLQISGIAVLVFLLLSLPAIIAYAQSLPYMVRGGKIPRELAMTNTMHPINLVSYFLPLTVWKLQPQITDVLGRNSYFGLFPFIMLLASFLYRQNYLTRFLKWGFILSLLFCLGEYGFIRGLLYETLPLFNTFRHPSLARFLCIFCGSLLCAFTFNKMPDARGSSKKKIPFLAALILIISAPFLFHLSGYSLSVSSLSTFAPAQHIKLWIDQSSVMDWFWIDLLIQGCTLGLTYFYFAVKPNIKALLIVNSFNVVLHAGILQPVVVVKNERVTAFQNKIDSYTQKGFPAPLLNESIISNSHPADSLLQKAYGPFNLFNKTIGEALIFVSPSPLMAHEELFWPQYDSFRSQLFTYPLLYKADTIITSVQGYNLNSTRKAILLNPADATKYFIQQTPTDYHAEFISYSPANWKLKISVSERSLFGLIQQHYPAWRLYVNGERKDLLRCNVGLMGIELNKGDNIVELKFSDPVIIIAIVISICTLLALLAAIYKL